jgi:chromosomal replication initiator protein
MATAPRRANLNESVDPPADLLLRLEQAIIERINADRYDLWFRQSAKFVWMGDQLIVGVANRFSQDWLQKNFAEAIQQSLTSIVGGVIPVRFVTDAGLFTDSKPAEAETPKATAAKTKPTIEAKKPPVLFPEQEETAPRPEPITGKSRPYSESGATPTKRRWKNLDDFIPGPCNRVAHASALSVVEDPAGAASPLVFYGPTGTGKTHLLEGIYLGIRRNQPQMQVRYLTAEDFMNRFVQAMYYKKQPSFRKQFRACDIFLMDDLTFLAGKQATQIEFLHTFDALISDGCIIIVTCDCHPRLSDDLMPELIDRLLGGAVWSMLPPDSETRLRILRSKSIHNSQSGIPEDVLQFLAERLRGNVRELEGAVHTLKHYSRAMGKPIDIPLVREALIDLLRHSVKVVTIGDVDSAICKLLAMQPGVLRGKSRSWAVSHPRMLAIYLCRKHTAASYSEISTYFQQKTHSTAVAAEKRVKQWIKENESVKAGQRSWKIKELIERVEGILHAA